MTDLKNNLEEVWNQEYKDFMLSFYPESSPLVSTWEIYRMAKIKSQKEIKNLLELTETLNQIRDNLQDENRKLEQELQRLKSTFAGYENFKREQQLEQELQKTREQLEKFALGYSEMIDHDAEVLGYEDGKAPTKRSKLIGEARQYLQGKEKDKQGE